MGKLIEPIVFMPNLPTTQEEEAQKTALLKDRAQFGEVSVFDIFAKPQFASVREHLNISSETVLNQAKSSPIYNATLHAIKLRDFIEVNGALTGDFEEMAQPFVEKAFSRMRNSQTTLEQAMHSDPAIAKFMEDNTPGVSEKRSDMHPAVISFLHTTKVDTLIDNNGKISEEYRNRYLADALSNAPLADLEKSNLTYIGLKLLGSTKNKDPENYQKIEGEYKALFDKERPYKSFLNERITIGDILRHDAGSHLEFAVDEAKLYGVIESLSNKTKAIADKRLADAVAHGDSVFDFIANQNEATDPTNSVRYHLLNVSNDGGKVSPLAVTILAATSIGENTLPPDVITHLKALPLSEVVDAKGINNDKLREKLIEPVKSQPMSKMGKYEDFLNATFGPEVAAAPRNPFIQDSHGYNIPNPALQTTLGALKQKSEKELAEYAERAFPAVERAERVIKTDSDHNPWPQFEREAPSGQHSIVVPYSFNVKTIENKNGNEVVNNPNVVNPRPLGKLEEDLRRYMLWRTEIGSGLKFEEVDKLPLKPALPMPITSIPKSAGQKNTDFLANPYPPVKKDIPEGMLFYDADLRKVDAGFNGDSAAGLAVGALTAPRHSQVDITATDYLRRPPTEGTTSYTFDFGTVGHEILHGIGLSHPHSPAVGITPMPGTYEDKVPGINTNATNMSYTESYTPDNRRYDNITPSPADYDRLRETYYKRPANEGNTVYMLEEGTKRDVIQSRDTTKVWVDSNREIPFSQTVVDTGGINTLDVSNVSGKNAHMTTPLDLNKNSHELLLINDKGEPFTPTYLSVLGKIQNAVAFEGNITGTPNKNILEVKDSGVLDGKGGDDTLMGGVGNTGFEGYKGHEKFVIRSDTKHLGFLDAIYGYDRKSHEIIAPENSFTAEYKIVYNSPRDGLFDGIPKSGSPETHLDFKDSQGNILKKLSVFADDKKELNPSDLHIKTTDGKPLKFEVAHDVASIGSVPHSVAQNTQPHPVTIAQAGNILRNAGGLVNTHHIEKSAVSHDTTKSQSIVISL